MRCCPRRAGARCSPAASSGPPGGPRAAVLRRFALAAMRLAFLEGADLGEPAAVAEAARRVALDPEEVAQGAPRPEVKERLRTETDAAHALGVIGVATIYAVLHANFIDRGDDRGGALGRSVPRARRGDR